MSLYQMCILMQFNDNTTLSLDAIRAAVDIPEQEFKRHLLSLCTPKLRILKKHSKGKVGYKYCSYCTTIIIAFDCQMHATLLLAWKSNYTIKLCIVVFHVLKPFSFVGHRGRRPVHLQRGVYLQIEAHEGAPHLGQGGQRGLLQRRP